MICKCFYIVAMTLEIVSTNIDGNSSWYYRMDERWSGQKCEDGGKHQSPIDIHADSVVVDYKGVFVKYGALRFTGYKHVLLAGVNNGRTIQYRTEGSRFIHPYMTGGPLEGTYRLEHIQLHWLSEHALDGRKYPVEIQLVHIRADLSVSLALKSSDGMAIIAIFCDLVESESDGRLDRTDELMSHIPKLVNTGDWASGVVADLTKLLVDNSSYYTYQGSLTSPDCEESVIWIVLGKPLVISETQYQLLYLIGKGEYNFRPLQPLRRQTVYSPAPESLYSTPVFFTALADMVMVVVDFVKNVTKYT